MPLIGQPTTVTADHVCDPKNDADVITARQQGKLNKGVEWECPVCKRHWRFVPEEWTKIVPRRKRSEDTPTDSLAGVSPVENGTPAEGEAQPAPEGGKIDPSSEAATSEPESEPEPSGNPKRASSRR